MKTFEKVLVIIIIIGLILNIFSVPGSKILVDFPILILSLFYIFFSFALLNDISLSKILKKRSYNNINTLRIIFSIFSGWAFSCFLLGFLSELFSWKDSSLLFWTGLVYIMICLIICLIKYFKAHSIFYKSIIIRIIIYCCFYVFIFLLAKPAASNGECACWNSKQALSFEELTL
jgi:hypothetical protein